MGAHVRQMRELAGFEVNMEIIVLLLLLFSVVIDSVVVIIVLTLPVI